MGPKVWFLTKSNILLATPTGQQLKTVFAVSNVGQEAFEITKLSMSCTCTSAAIDKSVVLPAQTSHIQVSISSGDDQKEFGANVIAIARFSDGSSKPFPLTVKGRAITSLVLLPKNVVLGDIKQQAGETVVTISAERGNKRDGWVDLIVESHSPAVRGKVRKIDEDKYSIELSFASSKAPIGAFKSDVLVRTLGPDGEDISGNVIRLSANVIGEVRATPGFFYLPGLNAGQVYSGRFESNPAVWMRV